MVKITLYKKLYLYWMFIWIFFYIVAYFNAIYANTSRQLIRNVSREIYINEDLNKTRVKETHKISITSNFYGVYFPKDSNSETFYICLDTVNFKQADFNKIIPTIKIYNMYGKTISYSKKIKNNCLIIEAKYYQDLRASHPITFRLEYTNPFVAKDIGTMTEIHIIGFSKDTKEKELIKSRYQDYWDIIKYKESIYISKKLGKPVVVKPKAQIKTTKNNYVLEYSLKDLIDTYPKILIGNFRVASFKISIPISATNKNVPDIIKNYVNNQVNIVLPQDDAVYGQKIYFTKVEPMPIDTYLDEEGNLIGIFTVQSAQDSVVSVEGYAIVKPPDFDVNVLDNVKISQVKEKDNYLQGTIYWQINDPVVKDLADKLKGHDNSILQILKKDLSWIAKNFKYREFKDIEELHRLGAVEAIKRKTGVCMDYSDVLIALLRAQGIPARPVMGDGIGGEVDDTIRNLGHEWVEVWFPNYGWIQVDPTWSKLEDLYIGPDYDHFVWYRAVDYSTLTEVACFNADSWLAEMCRYDGTEISPVTRTEYNNLKKVEALSTSDLIEKVHEKIPQVGSLQYKLWQIQLILNRSNLFHLLLSKPLIYWVLFIISVILVSILIKILKFFVNLLKRGRGQELLD